MATPYIQDDSGKYIASTQRPDGTWRKPRRVKDGYTPQEEVPVYENKYVKFFKSKPDLPPGMNPSEEGQTKQQQQKILGSGDSETAGLSKAAKRNMKRKEKRKQQQHGDGDEDPDADVDSVTDAVENVSISESGESSNKTAAPVSVSSPDDSSAEKAKKIKNLKKKLRQVEELKQKVDSGEITEPTKDQLEKLGRVAALRDELQQLERDS
ncbi:partner of Y14 and mago [Sebastes fasciatus]|uniref:partner of Y14 and mago n=1 Tax=Sebastes fasciatus TaxID=394691 RepID=UPI003D9F1AEF